MNALLRILALEGLASLEMIHSAGQSTSLHHLTLTVSGIHWKLRFGVPAFTGAPSLEANSRGILLDDAHTMKIAFQLPPRAT